VYTECTICFYDVVLLSPKIYQSETNNIHPWDPILPHHRISCFHWLSSNRGIPRKGVHYSSPIMDDLESFVTNVVERSSWEKSRCGRKCRFPPKGGLHHTSGDASLETHLEIPNWCHAYKSQSPSSRRTRVAAAEYRIVSQTHRGHSTKHRRCVNENHKRFKQDNYLREIKSRKVASLIYNAYGQTLSRTILLSAMGVMITRVYYLHP
jgi:hypothetical protein